MLENVEYFLALARSGSFSRAAGILGVSHVTISRRIEQFESQLGLTLFYRQPSGCSLTTEGEWLMSEALSLESACQDFQRQVRSREGESKCSLKVSVPDLSAFDFSHALRDFVRQFPDIQLSVICPANRRSKDQFDADVVVRMTNHPPDLLVGREIMRVAFAPYAAEDYLRSIDFNLKAADWIILRRDSWHYDTKAVISNRLKVENPRVVLKSDTSMQVVAGVSSGLGVGILSQPVAQQHPHLSMASPEPWCDVGVWLLTHPQNRAAQKVRKFMSFMANYDYAL